MNEFKKGTQIIYIPTHAGIDENHPDCEAGFVTSTNSKFVFCRYWNKGLMNTLRTTANSEPTHPNNLIIKRTRPQEVIDRALETIDNEYFDKHSED